MSTLKEGVRYWRRPMKMSPSHESMASQSFWCGFLFHAVLTMFMQDLYGKARYLDMVEASWLNIHPVVWVPFIAALGYWYIILLRKSRTRDACPLYVVQEKTPTPDGIHEWEVIDQTEIQPEGDTNE